MPFVTSKIYENLVKYDDKDLMISQWPKLEVRFENEEEILEKLKEIIVEIRNIRNTKNIHPSKKAELIIVTEKYKKELEELKDVLLKLGFGDKLTLKAKKENISENSIQIISEGIELYMPLEGLIDLEEEKKRIEEEKKKLQAEIERCEKMLSNPGFMNKAPQAKIDEEKEKLAKYKEMLKKL